ncbi:MAG: glycoside hydrolase family 36 protein [Actinomycetes bacterium]
MQLELARIELTGDTIGSSNLADSVVRIGPIEVRVVTSASSTIKSGSRATQLAWTITNLGEDSMRVRSVAQVFRVADLTGPLRMFRNGYQSWTPSGVATFGIDHDQSLARGSLEMVRAIHHADPAVAQPGELRSEWVSVLNQAVGRPLLVGFDGGDRHDGTLRLRVGEVGTELWAEAFLGDLVITSGETRDLHTVLLIEANEHESASDLLEQWADVVGRNAVARVDAPYQVGWCSWYHYFHDITERALRSNLAHAADWPFDVFQLDDGYQSAIGDWLTTNDRFPSDLGAIAASIAAEGRTPGLWLAPFIVAPDSQVASRHPDWLARSANGDPLIGMFNPPWGGGQSGFMWSLDTTNPAVISHLETVARELRSAGFDYLKLDFTFAPSFDGVWSDAGQTPAQRVRAGFDAIRRGAGNDAFLLGCGVPLSNVVGVVDGNRIGADVAPSWEFTNWEAALPGYERALPATVHAWQNTLARSFMHRKLWLNDPDCLMLRESETAMSKATIRTWAHAVAVSGGMALVSDDLALLDGESRKLLNEVIELGRLSDSAAIAGSPARCQDLLRHEVAREFESAGARLSADPNDGTSTLDR